MTTADPATPPAPPAPRPRAWDWRVEGVFLAVWIGLGVAVYTLGFAPHAEARRRSASDLDRLAGQEHELAQVRSSARDAQRRLDKSQQLREHNPVRLGRPSEINERLASINGLAEGSGIKLDQLEPGKPVHYARCAVVPIRIGGVTTFPGLVGFFGQLHEQFRDTAASGFKLSANQDPGSAGGRFAIDLAWYTAPEPKAPAK